MAANLQVALLIETSREYARGLLRGIARHQREHENWSMWFEPRGLDDPPPDWLAGWKGDGILARINDRKTADAILATGIPTVDVRGALRVPEIPFVGLDNRPIAKLAYEHLRDLGLRHFAFCGTPRGENPNQDFRCDAFCRLVEQDGRSCEVWLGEHLEKRAPTWEDQQEDLANWLRKLPKPVGIMTCHDDRGQQVLDACRRVDLAVPDHAAVISVDNDPCLCNLCTPTLTSIDVNPSRVGYAAAELLDRLMTGEQPESMITYLGPPRGIASRGSTDMLAIDDQNLAEAVRFVRTHATRGIRVSDVIARAGQSPSTLERRFRKVVGRTIKAEITRVKLNRAKLLLAETDYSVAEIAERSGFAESKYFCEVFRKYVGSTALKYRRTFRDE